jgi:hypothetical protein
MPKNPQTEESDWQKVWDARIAALVPILGKPTDSVYHATVPMYLGGFADVLAFPSYVAGMTYATAELTGEDVGQLPSSLGNYELMICFREDHPRGADMISRLARHTCEAKLEAGQTMDLPDFFKGSVIKALLFAQPSEKPVQFDLLGQRCGLLLCIGITAEELALKQSSGSATLLARLKQRGVFPYTVLQRESVAK